DAFPCSRPLIPPRLKPQPGTGATGDAHRSRPSRSTWADRDISSGEPDPSEGPRQCDPWVPPGSGPVSAVASVSGTTTASGRLSVTAADPPVGGPPVLSRPRYRMYRTPPRAIARTTTNRIN